MTDEERVRQLAYSIWEAEGRPEGQQQRHWDRAMKIVAAEQSEEEAEAPLQDREQPPQTSDETGNTATPKQPPGKKARSVQTQRKTAKTSKPDAKTATKAAPATSKTNPPKTTDRS